MIFPSKDAWISTFEVCFNLILFTKSALYIPQAWRIYKNKDSSGVSLLTFCWLLLIQISMIIHGLIHNDYALTIGYMISTVTCSSVVVLAFIYKKRLPIPFINLD